MVDGWWHSGQGVSRAAEILPVIVRPFKVGLGMRTGRASSGGFLALLQATAVAAAPDYRLFLFGYPVRHHAGGQISVAFLVLFRGNRHRHEDIGDLTEASCRAVSARPGYKAVCS